MGFDAQITGAASSYARKYALNGLFLIDDTKDADGVNDHKPDKHKEWAMVLLGHYQSGDSRALYDEFTNKSGEDQDFVSTAWKHLDSKTRAGIKDMIKQEREAE